MEALKDVDFEVRAGEVIGLLGDNGAGKSTLVKAIAGVQPADSGEAEFEGRPVSLSSPQAASRLGIATVYQDLALCENLDVVANLFLGQEVSDGGPGVLDETAMEHRSLGLLGMLGVTTITSVRTAVERLSGGQRQAVAMARSMLGEPRSSCSTSRRRRSSGSDAPDPRADRPSAGARARSGRDQPQSRRRLPGRRPRRGAAARADGGELRDRRVESEEVVAAITGAEFGSEDRDTEETRCERPDRRDDAEAERFSPAVVLRRLGRGELGSVQVLLGIAVIWTIFQLANDRFLSAVNLSNLTLQIAAVATISIGVVLVLLLGEIDLSVGAVSGLAASVMAVLSVNEGLNPVLALVAGLLVGTAIGLFNGFFVTAFGIPSFVVTLAGLLGWQGMQLLVLGETGSINLPPNIITDLTTTFFEPAVGWAIAIGAIAAYAASLLLARRRRVSGGLEAEPLAAALVRIGLVAAAIVAAVLVLNEDRGVPSRR